MHCHDLLTVTNFELSQFMNCHKLWIITIYVTATAKRFCKKSKVGEQFCIRIFSFYSETFKTLEKEDDYYTKVLISYRRIYVKHFSSKQH